MWSYDPRHSSFYERFQEKFQLEIAQNQFLNAREYSLTAYSLDQDFSQYQRYMETPKQENKEPAGSADNSSFTLPQKKA